MRTNASHGRPGRAFRVVLALVLALAGCRSAAPSKSGTSMEKMRLSVARVNALIRKLAIPALKAAVR